MDVAGSNRVGVHGWNGVRVRQDDVVEGGRCRVAAEHTPRLHGWSEAPQEREAVVAELLARPVRGLEHALVGLLVAEVERDEEVIRVPVDAWAAELLQQLDALARLRASLRDVPEREDQVRLTTRLQIGEGGAERDRVPVHVGEEGDAHTGTL